MALFFQQIMALPTVVFTALLGAVVVYWLFVILGALDIDVMGGDLEGAAESAVEGGAEAGASLVEGLTLLSFMTWLGLRNAPFTIVFSLIVLVGWTASMLANQIAIPLLGEGLLTATVVGLGSLLVALPITSVVSRPLGPLFKVREAEKRSDLVGRSCVIETGSVDERFGVGTVQEEGRWVRIEVRASTPNPLRRGTEALIVDYDDNNETFRVEAMA